MAPSWWLICSISSSVSFRRASRATFSTCPREKAMALDPDGERFGDHGPLDSAATDALRTDAQALDAPLDHDPDALEVGLELPPGDAGHLAADAAQVLRLAAALDAVA